MLILEIGKKITQGEILHAPHLKHINQSISITVTESKNHNHYNWHLYYSLGNYIKNLKLNGYNLHLY